LCVGAETVVKRYVPPRKGTLTLIITDGFTLKVLWIVCVLTVLLRGVVWLPMLLMGRECGPPTAAYLVFSSRVHARAHMLS
jgi:hypothetical protein